MVSELDGAKILLQGATALTVDLASWKGLAGAHGANKTPTKVIFFELEISPLLTAPHHYEDEGGGYWAGEYELDLIGRYLQTNQPTTPELYAALFRLWNSARETRDQACKNTARRREGEGVGRTAVIRARKGEQGP